MKDKPVILIVDDQLRSIELLEAHLAPQGYEIVKTTNSEEVIGVLSSNQIDLILMDVLMPGIDSFELTRRIRQDNAHQLLPIILVTALQETEDRIKGIEVGCDDFISKPFDKIELLARVRSLLKVKAYNDLMVNYRKELESEIASKTEELAQRNLDLKVLSERLTLATQSAKIGIWDWDVVRDELVWDNTMYRLYSMQCEDFGGAYAAWSQTIHPDDKAQAERAIREALSGEHEYALEFRIIWPDGSMHHVQASAKTFRTTDGKPIRMVGVNWDITDRKKAEQEIKISHEKTERVLEETIKTLAAIVEIRDPYTSGHQQRATQIATLIATELGLEQGRVSAIGTATAIHDIGKINIPTTILSKPGKLSELEYEMVKTHVVTGYDMLKNIDFTWPIAKIVLQHHERINGSGYPKRLKGDDIMLEAKIVAVADVVEAMASHRPYRPSLGIDQALKEIEENKAILYDPGVVDACIKIFKQGKFEL